MSRSKYAVLSFLPPESILKLREKYHALLKNAGYGIDKQGRVIHPFSRPNIDEHIVYQAICSNKSFWMRKYEEELARELR